MIRSRKEGITMTAWTAAALAYALGALGFLLAAAYHKPWMQHYPLAKGLASAGFLLTALAHGLPRLAPRATVLLPGTGLSGLPWMGGLLACLCLCAAGDVLLGLANARTGFFSRYFLAGAGCFTAAHAGLCALFARFGGRAYPWELLLPLALVGLAAGAARARHRFRLRRMAGAALVYSFFVGMMCAKAAVLALRTTQPLLAAGGVLFLASDCVLLFLYFYYKPRRAFRALNLITYYRGMLCLALCA